MYATLASRDVDCCLIPESPFYLEGRGGLFEYIEKRLKENGHMVIVIAEGGGQDLLSESLQSMNQQDASGNKLLKDVGLWISQRIKVSLAILSILFSVSHDIIEESINVNVPLHGFHLRGIRIRELYSKERKLISVLPFPRKISSVTGNREMMQIPEYWTCEFLPSG